MLTRASQGVWCDYCKYRWGKEKDGSWNIRAMKPALWTIISEYHKSKGEKRHYCQDCANDVQTWADGTFWKLEDQANYLQGQDALHGF